MKIDLSGPNPTIDAQHLGEAFDIPASEVQGLMRKGAITSRFETGVDADEGTFRLTFWHAGKRVRFTCGTDGVVQKTSRSTALRN